MEKPSDDMMDKMIDAMYTTKGVQTGVCKGWRENLKAAWRRLFEPETALLPCPFCGSEAKLLPLDSFVEWAVACQHPEGECNVRIIYCDTKEKAIAQWNRREAVRSTDEAVKEYFEYTKQFSFLSGKKFLRYTEWLREREGK